MSRVAPGWPTVPSPATRIAGRAGCSSAGCRTQCANASAPLRRPLAAEHRADPAVGLAVVGKPSRRGRGERVPTGPEPGSVPPRVGHVQHASGTSNGAHRTSVGEVGRLGRNVTASARPVRRGCAHGCGHTAVRRSNLAPPAACALIDQMLPMGPGEVQCRRGTWRQPLGVGQPGQGVFFEWEQPRGHSAFSVRFDSVGE